MDQLVAQILEQKLKWRWNHLVKLKTEKKGLIT